jgi:hypothetical protein
VFLKFFKYFNNERVREILECAKNYMLVFFDIKPVEPQRKRSGKGAPGV